MNELTLYIGNKNYSSWSLRPFLVLRKAGLPFSETIIQLDVAGFKDKLLALSEAGTVPVLRVGEEIIPDSLEISNWAALCVPNLWPKDAQDKRQALEMCLRMQSDFAALRTHAPMNLRRRTHTDIPQNCLEDAQKMTEMWEACLARHDGPFLFDDWCVADAFSTPYATRFVSYDIPRPVKVDTYISELMADEDFLDWEAEALVEPWELPETDRIGL